MKIIPKDDFDRVFLTEADWHTKLSVVSDMCRLNTLTAVALAGSGHLGSSFSSMDIFVWAYFRELNTLSLGFDNPDRDIFFSSKGHDAPALYSVLFAAGILSLEQITKLRRLGGLHGHPDISNTGIEANSGSLGMGISKARGFAWAKRYLGLKGRVFVLLGDGELQEGQIYEGMQGAAKQKLSNLTVIVDHNKIQTDRRVDDITFISDLITRFESFGWDACRCNGNNSQELEFVYNQLIINSTRPKIIIADTIKGRGVSFMEATSSHMRTGKVYEWHAGAPNKEEYELASDELLTKINQALSKFSGISLNVINSHRDPFSRNGLLLGEQSSRKQIPNSQQLGSEFLVNAFGQELVEIGKKRADIIVLDADLSADLGLRNFENLFPERFIEVGIAEQDMVSMAGGLAQQGLLPIVNSFGAFLSSRANEQIYNNATEESKIIYMSHYAGLFPAGPGKSHQSVRDISLLGSIPNAIIVQPSCEREMRLIFRYLVNEAAGCCVMRLPLGPTSLPLESYDIVKPTFGTGWTLMDGHDAILFAYGPHMLNQAYIASKILRDNAGIRLKVVNLPWLNNVNGTWLESQISNMDYVFVLDDHSVVGGLGDFLSTEIVSTRSLQDKSVTKFGLNSFPECGDSEEILKYHKLDGSGIATAINSLLQY